MTSSYIPAMLMAAPPPGNYLPGLPGNFRRAGGGV